jgi:hypothetical protein
LNEERLPAGWETKARSKRGVTFMSFNRLVNNVEFGIDERRGDRNEAKLSAFTSSNGKPATEPAAGTSAV